MSDTKEEELQEDKPGPPADPPAELKGGPADPSAESKGGPAESGEELDEEEEGEEEEGEEEGQEEEESGEELDEEEGEKVSLHSFKRGHLYFTKIKPYLETYSHSYVVSTLKLIEDNDNLLFFTDNSRSVRLFFVDQIVDYQEIPISKKTNTTSRMLRNLDMHAAKVKVKTKAKAKTNAAAGSDADADPVAGPAPPPGPARPPVPGLNLSRVK
jgi:hypothetical protein